MNSFLKISKTKVCLVDNLFLFKSENCAFKKIQECFEASNIEIVEAEIADIIIVPIFNSNYGLFDNYIRKSQLYKKFKNKIFCYSPEDLKYPSLPGIYPSASPFWAKLGWVKGAHYLSSHIVEHSFSLTEINRDLLFSFVGSIKTSPVRRKILTLAKYPKGLIVDSDPDLGGKYWWELGEEYAANAFDTFKNVMERTKFALCPRGISTSSIRLFEALKAGCVPVIISDSLVLPEGPNWKDFAIFVPEKDIKKIPEILNKNEAAFAEMSRNARDAWDNYFSDSSTPFTIVRWCLDIQRNLTPVKRILIEFLVLMGSFVLASNAKKRLKKILGR
jgi:hypothetical protein